MTTTQQTATPNALAVVQQTEQAIVRKIDAAAHGAATDIRRATEQARERIETATRDAAAFVAGVLAGCLQELEALASAVALDTATIDHAPALPAPASGPAVLPMPAAAQQTGAAAAPAAADDDEALMNWCHQQRQADNPPSWAELAEAVRQAGRDVSADSLRMRYARWRKAGE
jgi:vacuolar-type H+-ATPase subunit H